MYLLLGNFQMERSDYKGAIQSFEHARAQMQHNEGGSLLVVSLVSPLMGVCIPTYRNRSPSLIDIRMEI